MRPTKDNDNAKKIDAVIKAGRVIDRGRLSIPANGGSS